MGYLVQLSALKAQVDQVVGSDFSHSDRFYARPDKGPLLSVWLWRM